MKGYSNSKFNGGVRDKIKYLDDHPIDNPDSPEYEKRDIFT